MTQTSTGLLNTLVQFAQFLNAWPENRSAVEEARQRGWLDDFGNVTEDGRELADALTTQANTRSVFRPVA